MSSLSLMVRQIECLTPRIRKLLLVSPDHSPLPAFSPGAHIEITIAGDRIQHRAYSLVNSGGEDVYEIAVQLEDESTGGSRWLHSLTEGEHVQVKHPENLFSLDEHARHVTLIAGGIGITPILSMARHLDAQLKPYTLHYAGRSQEAMAYLPEVEQLTHKKLWITQGDRSKRFPASQALANPSAGHHLYICGPNKMVSSVLATARELGWPEDHLHYETFAGALEKTGDRAFEVFLSGTGIALTVAADKTVLDAMIEAGLDPLFDCRRGDCGVCVAQIQEGEADHRDICLSERERSAGSFCTCVSRATSNRLVLNI